MKKYTPRTILKHKIIGIYFSAHWCPPCRNFTPKLITLYNKLKSTKNLFEVIFVSFDKTNDEFNDYFSKMPWKAFASDNLQIKNFFNSYFFVLSIPRLVLIDNQGNIINEDAKLNVENDPDGVSFPWNTTNDNHKDKS